MLKNSKIPLVQSAVLEPFILAAQSIGTPIEKTLKSSGLSVQLLDDPLILLPEIPAWHFVSAISRAEGEPLLGLKAAFELAHQDIESLRPLIKGCINLKDLLERLCEVAPTQSSVNDYTLQEDGEIVWLNQKGFRLISDYVQVELFEIAGMIQLVQLVAGEDWRPLEINFSFDYDQHIDDSEHLNPSKIHFSKRYPGIAIPRKLLPLQLPELDGANDEQKISSSPDTIGEQLLIAVESYIGERKLNKKLLSDITGMNFRTLQRRLARESTSYFNIVDRARFSKSQFLLKETDENLLDISMMLGYENVSSFSRAFKRWAGVSPSEYRCL